MQLDPSVCYRVMRARDARFDGRFFVAVRTTGIYCRPVCPAPLPRRQNCMFVSCAAAAEQAGYRPCLRCRPEAAPGTPAWLGSSTTVARALRLIDAGALDDVGVDSLAARLGVGDRHLRRLFARHLGASPHAVAATRRTHFARQLIDETSLPMAEVAFAAGFASVRRFNDAMRSAYGRSPSALRRGAKRGRVDAGRNLELRLAYRPPYAWDAVLGFLAARAIPGVECVADGSYRRSFRQDAAVGWLEVAPVRDCHQLRVRIRVDGPLRLIDLARRLRALFDLGASSDAIAAPLRGDPVLARALASLAGVRVPGAFDGFELAVRAILGQQVSVAAATRLAGRLVEQFGHELPHWCGSGDATAAIPTREFPSPETLSHADVARIGVPGVRAGAIRALARRVTEAGLQLEPGADPQAVREALLSLPGIGDWTAAYIAMRALGEPDAFPAGDLGLCRALGVGAPELARRAETWRPWRAYAAMLLWQHAASCGR
ncbi:MAG TPA: AlkA N-terminal domain-containing protein [Myxococcota bacterium]|nr:AlkA N-terminal domain-containing protein [Myxococcota bacterium]